MTVIDSTVPHSGSRWPGACRGALQKAAEFPSAVWTMLCDERVEALLEGTS